MGMFVVKIPTIRLDQEALEGSAYESGFCCLNACVESLLYYFWLTEVNVPQNSHV